MTEYPIAYVKSLERELEATKYFVARQNAEIERLMNECKELRDIVATQRNENKYLRNQSGKRCGTCLADIPIKVFCDDTLSYWFACEHQKGREP